MSDQFNTLLDEYSLSKSSLAINPHGDHKLGYNKQAHKYSETVKGKSDLLLAKLMIQKADAIKFAVIEEIEGVYYITYNPYGRYLDNLQEMTYSVVEPLSLKPKSIKLYEAANGKKVKWLVKMMTGELTSFFLFKLDKWLIEDKYKKDMKDFCKAVSLMMRYNPHIDCYKYSVYMSKFVEWLLTFDEDYITIQDIINGILNNLKTIFYPSDIKKYKEEDTLRENIENAFSHLTWQDCSRACNDQFSKLDFKSEKHVNFLDMIKKRAEEAMALKQAKLQTMKTKKDMPVLKRKREQEEEDNTPLKIQKKSLEDEPLVQLSEVEVENILMCEQDK